MTARPLGVGIIGSGSVVQGIHVPTLARLTDTLAIRHVMDVDADAAAAVAARVGARSSGTVEELLGDDEVDIVAVCSPHRFHSAHVIAACEAGAAVVLCEKPLATTRDEAESIAAAARRSGTRLVVGAMHTFDPAWTFARERWGDLAETATFVRSSIVLPFNDRFEGWATEVAAPAALPVRDTSTPEARAVTITARILGLGIHDIPLVRRFLPEWRSLRVVGADLLDPVGYIVTVEAGGRVAQLIGSFRDHWRPEWEFEARSTAASVHVAFPPSYVHAGSARATVRRGTERVEFEPTHDNGYEREWRHAAALAHDPQTPTAPLDELVDDLAFALELAERAGDFLRAGGEEGQR